MCSRSDIFASEIDRSRVMLMIKIVSLKRKGIQWIPNVPRRMNLKVERSPMVRHGVAPPRGDRREEIPTAKL